MAGRIGKEGTEGWDEERGIRFARAAKREKCAKLAFPPSLPKNHRETVTMLSALVSERSLGHYEYVLTHHGYALATPLHASRSRTAQRPTYAIFVIW